MREWELWCLHVKVGWYARESTRVSSRDFRRPIRVRYLVVCLSFGDMSG